MSAEQQYDDCILQIRDEQYMRKALIEAEAALGEGEIPIGAVVVCREKSLHAHITLPRRFATLRPMPKCWP